MDATIFEQHPFKFPCEIIGFKPFVDLTPEQEIEQHRQQVQDARRGAGQFNAANGNRRHAANRNNNRNEK